MHAGTALALLPARLDIATVIAARSRNSSCGESAKKSLEDASGEKFYGFGRSMRTPFRHRNSY